jgi:CMP-N-acetylneuraminic acid synthetase
MIVAMIPARGGSKSIPNKNIKMIAGKPMVAYAIEAALKSRLIDEVYVSTDSEEIAKLCSGVNIHMRDPKYATDEASTASVMRDFSDAVDYDHLVVIQCTSPMLKAVDIGFGVAKHLGGKYESMVSVVRQHKFVWREDYGGACPVDYKQFRTERWADRIACPVNHKLLERPRRQDWDGMLVENGAFIIRERRSFMKTGSRLAGRVGLYEMPENSYIEIDNHDDFIMVERLLEDRND